MVSNNSRWRNTHERLQGLLGVLTTWDSGVTGLVFLIIRCCSFPYRPIPRCAPPEIPGLAGFHSIHLSRLVWGSWVFLESNLSLPTDQ